MSIVVVANCRIKLAIRNFIVSRTAQSYLRELSCFFFRIVPTMAVRKGTGRVRSARDRGFCRECAVCRRVKASISNPEKSGTPSTNSDLVTLSFVSDFQREMHSEVMKPSRQRDSPVFFSNGDSISFVAGEEPCRMKT